MQLIPDFIENDHEYLDIVGDLLTSEKLQKMDDIVHHYHSTRLRHSFFVSHVSFKYAKDKSLDRKAIARAGLLHDFFLEDRQEIADMKMGSHSEVHPKIALANARELTSISDLEEDIILSHMYMTCKSSPRPKYKESWIISMADKYCAINEFITPANRIVQSTYHAVTNMLVSN